MTFLKPPPSPSQVPVNAKLQALITRAQEDGKRKAETPPQIPPCNEKTGRGNKWLAQQFPVQIRYMAQKLSLSDSRRNELENQLTKISSKLTNFPIKKLINLDNDRNIRICYAEQYFKPIFHAKTFLAWFKQMTAPEYMVLVKEEQFPGGVYEEEKRSDRELLDRWAGKPPQLPSSENARKKYESSIKKYEEEKRKKWSALQGTKDISINKETLPPNLYISDVEPIVRDYLALLDEVLFSDNDTNIQLKLMINNAAYVVLALALFPLECLYDKYYGTYTIEDVIPCLDETLLTLKNYLHDDLKNEFLTRIRYNRDINSIEKTAQLIINIFINWAISTLVGLQQLYYEILRSAAHQSIGRVLLPESFTEGNKWHFNIQEKQPDGSMKKKEYVVPEKVRYLSENEEVFWILKDIWDPIATAVALVNQANITAYFNAGSNRWGGHHPPHAGHRRGNGLDFDMKFNGEWVPNVRARMNVYNCELDDAVSTDNSRNPLCLHGIWRVLGWAAVQAFILAGLDKYLYGDIAIIIESAQHLSSEFPELKLKEYIEWELFNEDNPSTWKRTEKQLSQAKKLGIEETQKHHNHWHFDMLIGQRAFGQPPYVWQVNNKDLLDRLYELAIARDQDIRFWKTMTGLDKIPDDYEAHETFKKVKTGDSKHWQVWWELRKNSIPLLPVWSRNSKLIKDTLKYDKCILSKCLIDKYIRNLGIPRL